ncbi:MAG: hypothetical protein ACO3WN_10300 [Burkholderiaceae bacterium]
MKNPSRLSVAGSACLLALLMSLTGCSDSRDTPPSTLRPDAAEKAAREQQARRDREERIRNTQDCYIEERRTNPNQHTTCIYRCPDGKLESENVAPGFVCPPMMNVLDR